MKLWIDQNQCTGSGMCALIAPAVFEVGPAGVSTVVIDPADSTDSAERTNSGVSAETAVTVPKELHDQVIEASHGCVGACIYIQE